MRVNVGVRPRQGMPKGEWREREREGRRAVEKRETGAEGERRESPMLQHPT